MCNLDLDLVALRQMGCIWLTIGTGRYIHGVTLIVRWQNAPISAFYYLISVLFGYFSTRFLKFSTFPTFFTQ